MHEEAFAPGDDAAIDDPNDNEASEEDEGIPELQAKLNEAGIEQAMEARYGPRSSRYSLRPHRPRDYRHLHMTALTQYSTKQGLKLFGEAGAFAIVIEMTQLHIRKVVRPVKRHILTAAERKGALSYLMFLKQ